MYVLCSMYMYHVCYGTSGARLFIVVVSVWGGGGGGGGRSYVYMKMCCFDCPCLQNTFSGVHKINVILLQRCCVVE